MINYNERFFKLKECRYDKKENTVRLVFYVQDNYEPEIKIHEPKVTKQLLDELGEKIKIEFEYLTASTASAMDKGTSALDALVKHKESIETKIISETDKTLKVKDIEYLLGRPINLRPVQIKHIRVSNDEQVTAGTICFMQKREYKKQDENGVEAIKPYHTFVLDDGADRLQCVYFPSEKFKSKFEMLVNKTVVCVIGVNGKRGNYTSFRVTGVSFCELS